MDNPGFYIACFGIMFALFQAVFLLFISGIRNDIREAKQDFRSIAKAFADHINNHAVGQFDCPQKV